MSIDILFQGLQATDANTPRNDKFGEAESLMKAIALARRAHEDAKGKPEKVDNEDVVIVANGDNLWNLWKEHAEPEGVSWNEFLDSNMHLKTPRNLGGAEQAGWNDWWLVHEGDVVFIPGEPAEVSDGNGSGRLVKQNGKWYFEVFNQETGRSSLREVQDMDEKGENYQILTHNGLHYAILKVEGDKVTVELLNPDKSRDKSDPKTQTFDMNDL